MGGSINFLPHYHSLLEGLKYYASSPGKLTNNDQAKALNYLYTGVLSRIVQYNSTSEPSLVIDIEGFLDLTSKQIKNLQKKKKQAVIDFSKDEYAKRIEGKITEANSFTEELREHVTKSYEKIHDDIRKIIEEIEDIKRSVGENAEKLEAKQKELERLMPLKMMFGGLNILTQCLSFLGPKGAAVGGVLSAGLNIGKGFACKNGANSACVNINLPAAAGQNIHLAQQGLARQKADVADKQYQQEKQELNKKNQKIHAKAADRIERQFQFNEQKIKGHYAQKREEELKAPLSPEQKARKVEFKKEGGLHGELFDDPAQWSPEQKEKQENYLRKKKEIEFIDKCEKQDIERLTKEKKAELQELKEIEDELNKPVKPKKVDRAAVILEKAQAAVAVAQAGVDLYNEKQNCDAEMEEVKKAIEANKEQMKQMIEYEKNIVSFYNDTLGAMKKDVDEFQDNLGKDSQVSLDVKKFSIKKYLGEIKHTTQKLTKGLSASIDGDLALTIQQVQEGLETTIGIYDRIQTFEEQVELANYIAHIGSDHTGLRVSDPTLQQAINRLDQVITQNVFLAEYSKAISALKQWAFPFAKLYLGEFEILTNEKMTLEDVVDIAAENLIKIKEKVSKSFTFIDKYGAAVGNGSFKNGPSTRPFYVWNGKDFPGYVQNFLQGRTTVFTAYLTEDMPSAVKFWNVGIKIRHSDSTQQKVINKTLQQYKIDLTTCGTSYFKYENESYAMSNGSFNIWYHIEKKKDKTPIHSSESYKKLSKGNAMLSPYGSWHVQLQHAKEGPSFYDLLKSSGIKLDPSEISLELEGDGYYVDEIKLKNIDSDLNVKKYYASY